jgi:hypothetical protein
LFYWNKFVPQQLSRLSLKTEENKRKRCAMQTSTVSDLIHQKNLADLPVLGYREENGKAVIEVQLRSVPPKPEKPLYDSAKMIAALRAGRIRLGRITNVTKDIRRERDSSPPPVRRRSRKSKKG